MNTLHATPAGNTKKQTASARALEQETGELDNLHKGLVRHFNAWRAAHDATTSRASLLMERMDSVIERLETRLRS
jgi:hypothetical protein